MFGKYYSMIREGLHKLTCMQVQVQVYVRVRVLVQVPTIVPEELFFTIIGVYQKKEEIIQFSSGSRTKKR